MSAWSWVRSILVWDARRRSPAISQRAADLEHQASTIALAQAVFGSAFAFFAVVQLTGQLYVAAGVTVVVCIVLPNLVASAARRLVDAAIGAPIAAAWTVYSVRLVWLLAVLAPSLWVLKH